MKLKKLLFWIKLRKYAHFAWFLLSIWCLSQLSIDEVKAGHCCFGRPGPRGRFLTEIRIRFSISLSNARKDILLFPFSAGLGKIFKLTAPIGTIFASLLELSTFRRSLWPSTRLRRSLKSTLATAPVWQMRLARRVHSQKFSVKIQPSPWKCLTVHPSGKSHLSRSSGR